MNAKKAKNIRADLRDLGINIEDKVYHTTHKAKTITYQDGFTVDGLPNIKTFQPQGTQALVDSCGAGLYRAAKRSA